MKIIPFKKFMDKIEEIYCEGPLYRLGGSAADGTCDCIGLIIGAVRRAGGSWGGIHGSNWAARFAVGQMSALRTGSQLKPGMLVFRRRTDTSGLPDRYQPGGSSYTGDMHDYYHVGVVTGTDPLRIRHCTIPTVRTDGAWSKWHSAAWPLFLSEEAARLSAGHSVLRKGSEGAEVRRLQQLLNKAGAGLAEDGVFGKKTEKAVKEYQQSQGLRTDGIVGGKTWGRLEGGKA